jgi:hypothetical protein
MTDRTEEHIRAAGLPSYGSALNASTCQYRSIFIGGLTLATR